MGIELKAANAWTIGDKLATREAYGKALVDLGDQNTNVVVLDADLSSSTQTKLFAAKFPDRFFNMGIAENNMMGVAAGLARAGKIPYASSFAMFAAGRAWEFVRNSIAHNHLAVKICATHAGLTVGEDGASHQIIEDIAIMRAIPTMTVIVPADATEAYQATMLLADHDAPTYLRLGRAKCPVVYDDSYRFEIGKASILKAGSQVTLIACGMMVSRALEAAQALTLEGIDVEVINSASIKPLDAKTICESARKTSKVITIEEHNIIGGLGEAVAACLMESGVGADFKRMGVKDIFGQSGDAYKLLDHYGLGVADIIQETKSLLKRSN
jgi:transketolase